MLPQSQAKDLSNNEISVDKMGKILAFTKLSVVSYCCEHLLGDIMGRCDYDLFMDCPTVVLCCLQLFSLKTSYNIHAYENKCHIIRLRSCFIHILL